MIRWRGRDEIPEQVANAYDSFVDLSPVSPIPAAITAANWSALLSGQIVPLFNEEMYAYGNEEIR